MLQGVGTLFVGSGAANMASTVGAASSTAANLSPVCQQLMVLVSKLTLRNVATSAGVSESAAAQPSGPAAVPQVHPPYAQHVKPELVDKYLSLDMAPKAERLKVARKEKLEAFKRHSKDYGSPEMYVAALTYRIRDLCEHFRYYRKDFVGLLRLEKMFHRRKRVLIYMRSNQFENYCYAIQKLGLKDIYSKLGWFEKYQDGTRRTDPVDDRMVAIMRPHLAQYRVEKTNQWYRLRPKLVDHDPACKQRVIIDEDCYQVKARKWRFRTPGLTALSSAEADQATATAPATASKSTEKVGRKKAAPVAVATKKKTGK